MNEEEKEQDDKEEFDSEDGSLESNIEEFSNSDILEELKSLDCDTCDISDECTTKNLKNDIESFSDSGKLTKMLSSAILIEVLGRKLESVSRVLIMAEDLCTKVDDSTEEILEEIMINPDQFGVIKLLIETNAILRSSIRLALEVVSGSKGLERIEETPPAIDGGDECKDDSDEDDDDEEFFRKLNNIGI